MYLNYKTGFSIGAIYGQIPQIIAKAVSMGATYAGIADISNTYGHVEWEKECLKQNIKPIFGVQLCVADFSEEKRRSFSHNWMTFIAKNEKGLKELYALVSIAHKQFYYVPRISLEQVDDTSDDLFVLGGTGPFWERLSRKVYREINPATPWSDLNPREIPTVWTLDNYYIDEEDETTYEIFADEFKLERKPSPMIIMPKGRASSLLDCSDRIAEQCTAGLPKANMVKIDGTDDFEAICMKGAMKRGISLKSNPRYLDRYLKEYRLIHEKGYVDYFMIVADLVAYAKEHMLVGPGRGSAAGSLICYFLGITEVDPIQYGLYFERFIDLNRDDLPDIDIDFPDDKRHLIIKYLHDKWGNVAQIANIGRLKPKSALNRVAKAIGVPLNSLDEIKNTGISLEDAFKTESGRKLLETYPALSHASKLEGHVSYIGKHAAGVLVCNEPISDYCGIDNRTKDAVAMIDKRDAEYLGLLKIDALGLRTLAIIAETCEAIGMNPSSIYDLPTDDAQAFNILNSNRFSGIFQFEKNAVQSLAKQMRFESISDIAAVSALGRPGPLGSGASWDYVSAKNAGINGSAYNDERVRQATKETHGVIVYQEQVMEIVKQVGELTWPEVGELRKLISKSKGSDRRFVVLGAKFLEKASAACGELEAMRLWEAIKTFGSYAFNKSHAVCYALISYFCAYLKAHYPLEFTMASLNHPKDDNSAIRLLRDMVENEGIDYKYVDREYSSSDWSVRKTGSSNSGRSHVVLLGGLSSIHGIGPASAKKIVKLRNEGKPLPAGIRKHLNNGISPFKHLYPATQLYGEYYTDYQKLGLNIPVTTIQGIKEKDGSFNFIGKLTEMSVRDLNEQNLVQQRNGKYATGQTAYLVFQLEDDTASIRCKINAGDYLKLGRKIAENAKIDKSWFLVHGRKANGWEIIFVKNIMEITKNV